MAYAALASIAQTIGQILNHDRYSISLHQRQQMTSINEKFIFLQAFLEGFPEKAKSLKGRIRDVANEAEDLIEYFMLEQIRLQCGLIHATVGLANEYIRYDLHELQKVTNEVDAIAREVMDIKNSFRIKNVSLGDGDSSSRHAPTGKSDMIGFVDDLIAIKERLCGESSRLQVIPIVGMGGIGKTTLARNAYDDPLTIEHFMIRAWVTVSQDYSVEQILSSLLASMKEFIINTERSGESNEEKVYKSLKGRKYLLVMDDMWSTKAWDDVKMIFPDDGNGSRIMLTTRLTDVANFVDSCSALHEMRFMDADQSWNLLRQKVFTHNDDCLPELEEVGQIIAKGCKGLPLAIAVIAGLLSTVSKNPASWKEIADNVNSVVATKDGQFEKILSLSYTHLPHHLRPCFLYMGCFPEDYEVSVSKLTKLWVAEGFLKYPNGSKSFEEWAEYYLEDLVKRNLVLVTKRKFNGKIKSCSLHDLVRDLCIRKSGEEKFLLHGMMDRYTSKVLVKNQHRMSIFLSDWNFLKNISGSNIRTIICFRNAVDRLRRKENRNATDRLGDIGNFKLLKILDVASASHLDRISTQIFEQFHLRYLALHHIEKIPAAISNLQNLQTLIIVGRIDLPLEIWRMPQLRHLVSSGFGPLSNPNGSTFALENLADIGYNLSLRRSSPRRILRRRRRDEVRQSVGSMELYDGVVIKHRRRLSRVKSTPTRP